MSAAAMENLEMALERAAGFFPLRYAQWVIQSPKTWDYLVIASRFPLDGSCYEIAHRPGVIGQVFRRQRPIFLAAAQEHALYDSFDPFVEWELAVPLFDGDRVAAVLNMEGTDSISLDGRLWGNFADILLSATGWLLPEAAPRDGEVWMVRTEYVQILSKGGSEAEALVRLGGFAANGGACVVIVGDLGLPESHVYPTLGQAVAAGYPLEGCVRGGGPRLDFLPTGPANTGRRVWWGIAEGRYDIVLHAVENDKEVK